MSWMVRYGYASSYQQIEREFLASRSATLRVKAILFYFDTPGGSAIGCKRIADHDLCGPWQETNPRLHAKALLLGRLLHGGRVR
jgi:hypothetical protein